MLQRKPKMLARLKESVEGSQGAATSAAKASRPGDGPAGMVAEPSFPDRRDGR